MPHPGDIHHCKICGSKGAAKTAAADGLCGHREACEGTGGLIHDTWFMRKGEVCKSCEVMKKANAKRQREQRKRDEKQAKKRGGDPFFKQTPGRKSVKTRRGR